MTADLNEWGVNVATVVRMDSPWMGVVELDDQFGKPTGERAIFHVQNVTGAGLVCRAAGALPAPCWRADYSR